MCREMGRNSLGKTAIGGMPGIDGTVEIAGIESTAVAAGRRGAGSMSVETRGAAETGRKENSRTGMARNMMGMSVAGSAGIETAGYKRCPADRDTPDLSEETAHMCTGLV